MGKFAVWARRLSSILFTVKREWTFIRCLFTLWVKIFEKIAKKWYCFSSSCPDLKKNPNHCVNKNRAKVHSCFWVKNLFEWQHTEISFLFFYFGHSVRVKGQTKLCSIDFDFSKITIVSFWEAKFISCVLSRDTQLCFRVHALLPK